MEKTNLEILQEKLVLQEKEKERLQKLVCANEVAISDLRYKISLEVKKEEASKRPNLNKAFRELRKAGYFAKQNFLCCSSCAIAAIPEDIKDKGKAVFYHGQDADNLKEFGNCFMNWWGDLKEILTILKRNNIKILNEKELDEDTRINISIRNENDK